MRQSLLLWAVALYLIPGPMALAQNPHVASTPPLAPEEQARKFTLPPGFVMELVAAEPDINKPINIAFDAMGRLWVTGSVEYPYAAAAGKKPRDKVWILSDFAPNGWARKVTTFADELNIPIGVLPLPDCQSALVYSIPNIYLMRDTDGDGQADQRQILYSQYGFKDTHGMTGEFMHGFDGWVYCCHGFANSSKVKSKGDTAIQMQSGNTYRIKPDGSKIEQHAWGQVNPFGLAFDPLGNLYSTDCHTRPLYQLLKGAHYPSFGKPHDGLGFGPEMVTHSHGSTALCGVAYYAADQFPSEFHNNLFIGNVVTNRINRDRIEWKGTTPKGIEMPDLVQCSDPWFRPVDIKLGPDGALYVADFYNRIIGHYEVPLNHPGRDREKGRIWRIRFVGGQEKPLRPVVDMTKASIPTLIGQLANVNLSARLQATQQLAHRGGDEVIALARKAANPADAEQGLAEQQLHAMWVLARLNALDDETFAAVLTSKDRQVRVHALKVLAERAIWNKGDRQTAFASLKDADPFVQRAAAEALAAHPTSDNVTPLIALRRATKPDDSHLVHVTRMAIRNQLLAKETWAQLPVKDMPLEDLHVLADVVFGVHSEESAEFLKDFLARMTESPLVLGRFGKYMARHGKAGAAEWVLKHAEEKHPKNLLGQADVLKAVQQGLQERGAALGPQERSRAEALALKLLQGAGPELQAGADLAVAFAFKNAWKPLFTQVIVNGKAGEPARKSAVAAFAAIDPKEAVAPLLGLLRDPSTPIALLEQIAATLANTNQPAALKGLAHELEVAPARLQTAIALGLAGSSAGGQELLETVAKGKASARLLQDPAIQQRLQQAKVPNVKERLAKLTKGLPPADQRAHSLIAQKIDAFGKAAPDAQLGLKVFQKHCAACHQIANQGAKLGPQLDGIGIRGLDRLLEDMLDPNRNVDQAFRLTTLVLDNGQLVSGLFLRQDGEILVMADKDGKEVRVAATKVQERQVTGLSPMPGNFAELIAEPEFSHLIAYLLQQRAK